MTNNHPLIKEFFRIKETNGLSYTDLGETSGVSRITIWQWSRKNNPTLTAFEAVLNSIGYELCIREMPK